MGKFKTKINLNCLACNGDLGLSGRKYRESWPDYVTTCYATCKICKRKYLVGDDGVRQIIIKELTKSKKEKEVKEKGLSPLDAFVKKLESQHKEEKQESPGWQLLLNTIEENKNNVRSLDDKLEQFKEED